MITPVNGHLLIEPIEHKAFMASSHDSYEEIGIVVASANGMHNEEIKKGDKVYFDSWLAAKYPKGEDTPEEYYWLVKWEDVRAIEHAESESL